VRVKPVDVLAYAEDLSDLALFGRNASKTDLSGANLHGADLSAANLSRADLGGADISGGGLLRVNLSEANLGGAKLLRAELREVNLTRASLFTRSHLINTAQVMQVAIYPHRIGLEKARNRYFRSFAKRPILLRNHL